jgi:hypothetical protein
VVIGSRVHGLGFEGFRVQGLEIGMYVLGAKIYGSGFRF